ncbi:hypothetical protein ACM0LK_01130 [Mycoplasma sp. Z331B]|uniref:hypothetical protein n=1 Tax=Mycoplasma sp. Z331B TaxID=3398775 RepID=UPI003A878252
MIELDYVKFKLDPTLKNKLADFSKKPEAQNILRRRGNSIYSEVKAQLPYDTRNTRDRYNKQKHMRDRFKITERISKKQATSGELFVSIRVTGINKKQNPRAVYPLVQLWGSRRKRYYDNKNWIDFKTSRNPDLLRKTAKQKMVGIKSEVISAYENYGKEIDKGDK